MPWKFDNAIKGAKEAYRSNNGLFDQKCSEIEEMIEELSSVLQFGNQGIDDRGMSDTLRHGYCAQRSNSASELEYMKREYQSLRRELDPNWNFAMGTKRAQLKPQQSDRPFVAMFCADICS